VTGADCANHPDRPAVERLGFQSYCAACRDALAAVTRSPALRALPRECFASYGGAERWLPLARGAPAHWLAHELGVRAQLGRAGCAAGHSLDRADLLAGRREVRGEPPRRGDLWVDLDAEGCGLVVAVQHAETRGFAISIRHLEPVSARDRVADFYAQLTARGRFFR
jgi:hypothetical protein